MIKWIQLIKLIAYCLNMVFNGLCLHKISHNGYWSVTTCQMWIKTHLQWYFVDCNYLLIKSVSEKNNNFAIFWRYKIKRLHFDFFVWKWFWKWLEKCFFFHDVIYVKGLFYWPKNIIIVWNTGQIIYLYNIVLLYL